MTKKTFNTMARICFSTILCAIFVSSNASRSANADFEKTLILCQSSDALGLINTYVNKSSLKILIPDTECYLISKAPTWKIVLYNSHNKLGFEMSSSEWMKHNPRFLTTSFDNRWSYRIIQKEKLTWLGMPATKFLFPCRKVNGVLLPPKVLKGEYITAQSPIVSSKACSLLQKTLMVPEGPGIPLYLITRGKEMKRTAYLSWRTGGDTPLLRTIRTEEKNMPSDFFNYPAGYIRKDLEIDVLMDRSRKQAIEEMLQHMENFK